MKVPTALIWYFGPLARLLLKRGYRVWCVCPDENGSAWGADAERFELTHGFTDQALVSALDVMMAADIGVMVCKMPEAVPPATGKKEEHAYQSMWQGDPAEFFYDGCGCDDPRCGEVWNLIFEAGRAYDEHRFINHLDD